MTKVSVPFALDPIKGTLVDPQKAPVFHLGWYFPESSSVHKKDKLSRGLRELGTVSQRQEFIDEIAEMLHQLLEKDAIVCIAPHPDQMKSSLLKAVMSKVTRLSGHACENIKSSLFIRTKTISYSPADIRLTEDQEKMSIVIVDHTAVEGRDIVVLDAVTTTESRLKACRKLLIEAGAKSVTCLAIGKTFSKSLEKPGIPYTQYLLSRSVRAFLLIAENQKVLKEASPNLFNLQTQTRLIPCTMFSSQSSTTTYPASSPDLIDSDEEPGQTPELSSSSSDNSIKISRALSTGSDEIEPMDISSNENTLPAHYISEPIESTPSPVEKQKPKKSSHFLAEDFVSAGSLLGKRTAASQGTPGVKRTKKSPPAQTNKVTNYFNSGIQLPGSGLSSPRKKF